MPLPRHSDAVYLASDSSEFLDSFKAEVKPAENEAESPKNIGEPNGRRPMTIAGHLKNKTRFLSFRAIFLWDASVCSP